MKRKVVFWGKGSRAEEAFELLTDFELLAVVDSNEEFYGSIWHGVPVISFSTYLSMCDKPIVIVTPDKPEMIVDELYEAGIERYILLNDLLFPSKNKFELRSFNDSKWKQECMEILGHIYYKNWQLERQLLYRAFLTMFFSGSKMSVNNEILYKIKNAKMPVINTNHGKEIIESIVRKQVTIVRYAQLPKENDLLIFLRPRIDYLTERAAMEAKERGIDIVFAEEGFINSIEPFMGTGGREFTFRHSIIFDEGSLYMNAHVPSRIENILNSNWSLNEKEFIRARTLMEIITREKISKYNCQPMGLKISAARAIKVLVVDQVYGDKSIEFGMANDENTFKDIIKAAVEENPDAEIYIKAHPVISKGHFADVQEMDNIHILTEAINPIDLLQQMDKVYVVSSQMGFEAVMCGCEVHCFGMPFYAGWGLTHDRLVCERRRKKRTVEEVFYAAYVLATVYVSFKSKEICELEQVIEELLEARRTYFDRE
ncbi:beta-3-deoxy-D-manno-oct-2-ulosonic acid transferase [Selenomonas sp. FC4001]|uniref:capsular polysaccharide export protein, LipB/KpsS family n=1 Tax=Selenomonas sp. FC4001 TaxID=1408313 RepID=UPI000689542D|nr:beta-3-deoxy-D-manno-oct-2-ulosonic acid transferase [Selenomonas sp. FC4001]